MTAIYRVDGNSVVTSPDAAGPWDRRMQHGSAGSEGMRAVGAADFPNGTASTLDFRAWTYINADLTVSFARQPVGEWILLDGDSWVGPDGAGWQCRGSPTGRAISAAQCRAW